METIDATKPDTQGAKYGEPAAAATGRAEPTEARKALVKEFTTMIAEAKRFWGPVYEQVRNDINFAGGDQWQDSTEDQLQEKYKANFVQRELNQQVSAIYAKNPTPKCTRKQRLEYTAWDGTRESLQQAKQAIEQAAAQAGQHSLEGGTQPPAPPADAVAIVTDYAAGQARKRFNDRLAQTLELLLQDQMDSQMPPFEGQMKDLVLREKTTGAGFVIVKYKRQKEQVPTESVTHVGLVERVNAVLAKAMELKQEQGYGDDSACAEELRLMVAGLAQATQRGDGKVMEEGVVYDFRPTTSVILDTKCRSLLGFVGAQWVAEELMMSPEQVEGQWHVDVRKGAAKQYAGGVELQQAAPLKTKAGGTKQVTNAGTWPDNAQVCVWILYHRRDQLKYVICDGYEDFLEEPEAPWPPLKRFWPILPLKLNRIEVEENRPQMGVTIYGESAVRLLRPMQQEKNRSQEGLRQHRVANKPGHVCGKDDFDKADRENLANRAAHDVIPLNNLPPGEDIRKRLMAIPTVAIDKALYDTTGIMQDALLVSGTQQANLGQQAADEKATGQAIAEQSRITSASSEVDSLDNFMSELMQMTGEMLLLEMQEETVKRKVGPGAAWPKTDQMRTQLRDEVTLKVEGSSSGRPNRNAELANLQAMMPYIQTVAQALGLSLEPILRYMASVMEWKFDLDEWLASAQPQQPAGQQPRESVSLAFNYKDLEADVRPAALQMAGLPASKAPVPPAPQGTPGPNAPAMPSGGPAAKVPNISTQATRMAPK